jgi:hypothetical protein
MAIRDKILAALGATDRLCDDCLSEITGVTPRQSINIACRTLNAKKELTRAREDCSRCRHVKIVNRARGVSVAVKTSTSALRESAAPAEGGRPWYWEGNVQRKIVEYLKANGWTVLSEADTASRQQGKDIVASDPRGQLLWVTVKGFPERTKNTQARHWFAGAHHDLARYRNEGKEALLAMGLPHGFKTYEGLIKRDDAVRRFLGYRVYWVRADGTVSVDTVPDAR